MRVDFQENRTPIKSMKKMQDSQSMVEWGERMLMSLSKLRAFHCICWRNCQAENRTKRLVRQIGSTKQSAEFALTEKWPPKFRRISRVQRRGGGDALRVSHVPAFTFKETSIPLWFFTSKYPGFTQKAKCINCRRLNIGTTTIRKVAKRKEVTDEPPLTRSPFAQKKRKPETLKSRKSF